MSDFPDGSITVKDLFVELKGMHSDLTRVLTHMERVDERNRQADQLHTDHEGRLRTAEHEVQALTGKVDGLIKDGADQEGRMRSLEKFRWQVVGALLVINALAVIVEWILFNRK
jgi:hypothetical protein